MVAVPTTPRRAVQVQPRDQQPLQYARARDLVSGAVTQFGGALGEDAETWNAVEAAYDQAEVVDRDNRYAVSSAEALNEFANLKGEAPAQQIGERIAVLDQSRKELLASARSERSRNIMKRNLDVRFDNARLAMRRHADAEMFKFRDDGLASSVEIAAKEVVRGYGTEAFGLNLATATLRLGERARLNGWSPERLADETAKLDAGIRYDTVIALATQGEPTDALKLAEEWKERFAPEQYARLNQLLRPRAEAKVARDLAPDIVEEAARTGSAGGKALATTQPAPVQNAKVIAEQVYPGISITSNRRAAGAAGNAGSRSWHVKSGAAIDARPIKGMTFAQYVQGYRDKGYTIIESLDETDPATMRRTGATGPHWHVVLGEKRTADTAVRGGTALDPRMDPEFAATAARKYAEAHNLSESQTDALVEAARDHSADLMRRRNIVEQEEERQFDKIIVDRGIDMDNVTSEAQLPADAWDGLSPSSQAQKRQQFSRNQRRIAEEREKELEAKRWEQILSQGQTLNPFDEAARRAVNETLKARGGSLQAGLALWEQTSIVPSQTGVMLRGGLVSTDPAQIHAAANVAGNMLRRNPNAFAGVPGGEEIERAALAFNHYVYDLGMAPKDAAQRVARENAPEFKAKTKYTEPQLQEWRKQVRKQGMDNPLPLFGSGARFSSPATRQQAMQTYQELIVDQLQQGHDIATARALAGEQMKKVYGPTKGGGVIAYPPEKGYPPVNGSHDYLYRDAIDTVKAETGRNDDPATIQFKIIPGVTDDDFRNGRRPRYGIVYSYIGKDGQRVYDQVHGLWAADVSGAAKRVNEANARRFREARNKRNAEAAAAKPGSNYLSDPYR